MKRFYVFLFATCFFFSTLFSSGVVESIDGLLYVNVARSLVQKRDISVEPKAADGENIPLNVFKGKNGKFYTPSGLGYSLVLLPAAAASYAVHALTDTALPKNFPLETDWVVHLFASFTNSIFAGMIVCLLFAFLRQLKLPVRTALAFSLIGFFTTNLFPYAKHSFAHLMFASFLLGSFYALRCFVDTRKSKYLFLSGLCFGIFGITYNPVFILAFPILLLYFYLLSRQKGESVTVRQGALFVLGALPGAFLFLLTSYIKTADVLNTGYGHPIAENLYNPSLRYMIEGFWGLLFSPGRSFFLYSPLLLFPVIFWNSLPLKRYSAEFISFSLLFVLYLYFYAIQVGMPDNLIWNGESSWGPRYLMFTIPFGVILTALTYNKVRFGFKRPVIVFLLLVGLAVQLLGVLLPYQIKFAGLHQLEVQGINLSPWDYGNFIPRYSPVLNQPRKLAKALLNFGPALNEGEFHLQLREGFGLPFKVGNERIYRDMRDKATLHWENTGSSQIVTLQFINVPTETSSSSARISIYEGDSILEETEILAGEEKRIDLFPQATTQQLYLEKSFTASNSASQPFFLQSVEINGKLSPLGSYDFAYSQPLNEKLTQAHYLGLDVRSSEDQWKLWDLRSQIYEQTLDIWWIRHMYYWDLPHTFFWCLLLLNGALFILFARLTYKQFQIIQS